MPSSAPNMHTCCELESALRSKRTYASPPHRAQLRLGSETSTHGRVLREPGRANSRQPAYQRRGLPYGGQLRQAAGAGAIASALPMS